MSSFSAIKRRLDTPHRAIRIKWLLENIQPVACTVINIVRGIHLATPDRVNAMAAQERHAAASFGGTDPEEVHHAPESQTLQQRHASSPLQVERKGVARGLSRRKW